MPSQTGDMPHLWSLIAREMWRRMRRRLRVGPVYKWRFSGRVPDRLLIAPPDLRSRDAQVAHDMYLGHYSFAGHVVNAHGISPFDVDVTNEEWLEVLHGFRWLRHMRAAGTDLACLNARALVHDWIKGPGSRIESYTWHPSIVAIRVIAWLQHSTVVLQGSDLHFYRLYLKSLSSQIRYLRAMAPEMRDGQSRLRARIALAYCGLSLPYSPSVLRAANRNLANELNSQILPDGGHISRSPCILLDLLADLVPLRQTYTNQAETPPDALVRAVERMLPMLRFFRHQDGDLARFNGVGATHADRIMSVLQHDEVNGAPLLSAPHSGYQRLQINRTTVIADTGKAPPLDVSHDAHAGFLSFELSSGRDQFIVNCGVDERGPGEYRTLSRATAAHSTATLNDTSSARFSFSEFTNSIIGAPLTSGPKRVECTRHDDETSQGFTASHDGFLSKFRLCHSRQLKLSDGGALLEGWDRFLPPKGTALTRSKRNQIDIRFHIHPDIVSNMNDEGEVVLTAATGETWTFAVQGVKAQLDDSIFFAGIGGPTRSKQIVVSFNGSEIPEVHWRMKFTPAHLNTAQDDAP